MLKKIIATLFCVFILSGCVSAVSAAQLSPAFDVISQDCAMSKSSLTGYEMCFSELDFTQALSHSSPEYIEITSLPNASSGKLKLGGADVYVGQVIPISYTKLLTFLPSNKTSSVSEFTFKSNTSSTELICHMNFLDKLNYAPTIRQVDEFYECVSGSTLYAPLSSIDPEGDNCSYILVEAPEKGSVKLEGSSFCYTPNENKKGSDSFKCVCVDEYGNYSPVCEIKLKITTLDDNISDLDGLECENSARILANDGIMALSGDKFMPELEMTRIDFIGAVMKLLDIGNLPGGYQLPFTDCSTLSKSSSDILASAMYLGYVCGSENASGELCFYPYEAINSYEAQVILARALGVADDGEAEVSSLDSGVPAWARTSVAALKNCGINIECSKDTLTRGDVADILYTVKLMK